MTDLPWAAEVPVTAKIALEAIKANFLDFEVENIKSLNSGWDNSIYLLNGNFVFRFPKRPEVQSRLQNEIAFLDLFRERSPIPVPNYRFRGKASPSYPFLFTGHELLPGLILSQHQVNLTKNDFEIIVQFIKALQSLQNNRVSFLPEEPQLTHVAWTEDKHTIETRLAALAARNKSLHEQVLEFLSRLNWPLIEASYDPVPIHSDLVPDNVLISLETGRLSAIIDWTEISLGDPAIDIGGLGYCFGKKRMYELAERLHPNDLKRINARAELGYLVEAVTDVWYGREDKNQALVDFAIRKIEEFFEL